MQHYGPSNLYFGARIPHIYLQEWVNLQPALSHKVKYQLRLYHGEDYWLVNPKVHGKPTIQLLQNGTKTRKHQRHQICQLVSSVFQNEQALV